MVRDLRIKEYRFPRQTFSADTVDTIYTDHSINGEILQVDWDQQVTNGSIVLSISGAPSTEFFRRNAGSGASWQSAFPRVFSESVTGSIANAGHVPFVVASPVGLSIGSMTSGASATNYLDLVIKYR